MNNLLRLKSLMKLLPEVSAPSDFIEKVMSKIKYEGVNKMNYKRHQFFEELREKIAFVDTVKNWSYRKKKLYINNYFSYMSGYLDCLCSCGELTKRQRSKLCDIIMEKIYCRLKGPGEMSEVLYKKPTALEFVEALERKAKLCRGDRIDKLDIRDCLDWVEEIIDDFRVRLSKIGSRNFIIWKKKTMKNNKRRLRRVSKKERR